MALLDAANHERGRLEITINKMREEMSATHRNADAALGEKARLETVVNQMRDDLAATRRAVDASVPAREARRLEEVRAS